MNSKGATGGSWGSILKPTLDILGVMLSWKEQKKILGIFYVVLKLILDIMKKKRKFREPKGHNLKLH